MLDFTKKSTSAEENRPLTIQEQRNIFKAMCPVITEENRELFQRFLNHYRNLQHYADSSGGLWCTDRPDKVIDNNNSMFQLKF